MSSAFADATAYVRQPVIGNDDERWLRLREVIEERALLRGTFTLSSGATSNYFFQLRQATMHPEGQFLIGMIIAEFMEKHGLGCIGGLEMGAVPVVNAVGFASYIRSRPVQPFFVRKAAKDHGAKELVDGYLPEGSEVLFVDDVTTTAGSTLKAIDNARSEKNFDVKWALSIVDREAGGAQNLGECGIQLASIFTKADFGL